MKIIKEGSAMSSDHSYIRKLLCSVGIHRYVQHSDRRTTCTYDCACCPASYRLSAGGKRIHFRREPHDCVNPTHEGAQHGTVH